MDTPRFLFAVFLAGAASTAAAADAPALTECVDLGPDIEIVRAGSSQSFLLRDGEAYYRVAFRDTCSSMAMASSVKIRTDGVDNRLCPRGTKVHTNTDICSVSAVEPLDAEEFAKRKKRVSR